MSEPYHAPLPESADDLLACDFVVGILKGPELSAVQHRIARDEIFAALVAGWQKRLSNDTPGLPPIEPPAHVWEEIVRRTKR
jgi:anti-sigma-K factor RskA